uniref:Uncharacterized protein n=1 Tax=Opuntia streptacantha TaxID=393608 RepID=A0A7C9AAJ6_OPUST
MNQTSFPEEQIFMLQNHNNFIQDVIIYLVKQTTIRDTVQFHLLLVNKPEAQGYTHYLASPCRVYKYKIIDAQTLTNSSRWEQHHHPLMLPVGLLNCMENKRIKSHWQRFPKCEPFGWAHSFRFAPHSCLREDSAHQVVLPSKGLLEFPYLPT